MAVLPLIPLLWSGFRPSDQRLTIFPNYISSLVGDFLPPQLSPAQLCPFQLSTTRSIACQQLGVSAGRGGRRNLISRSVLRLGLPSKGRMAEETLELLKECQLTVKKSNPRQYLATIQGMDNVEVWFQRENDVMRRIRTGDIDLGIVGYDTACEYGQGDEDVIVVHDSLCFGECRLAIGIPTNGVFRDVSSVEELLAMPQWTSQRPLRIATGFSYLAREFLNEKQFKYVQMYTSDGALEAAPAMGIADVIIDLVGSGMTLHENNLKEIAGGTILLSQGVLVANKWSLLEGQTMLKTVHEILERLEAHLRARNQFVVMAHMRGASEHDVSQRILSETELHGLQGPTVSPVFCQISGQVTEGFYAISICVTKNHLYNAVSQLRMVGASGVLVTPVTYIFDETPIRWHQLLEKLNLSQNSLE